MLLNAARPIRPGIAYPERDGKPMADNTRQFLWIQTIEGNLQAMFRDRADVFVAGDNLWYPVEGELEICQAPDVYVVFGRPKGHRGSYKQWLENNIPLTVVFEILSPGNTGEEMTDKLAFYDEYGVEEYYIYNPDNNTLQLLLRQGEVLIKVRKRQLEGFASPRLGIRFDFSGPEMVILRPDGRPFLTFEETEHLADQANQRAARLAELSRKARGGQASPAELQELEQLEEQLSPGSP